jgi:hypothetical protein
MRYASTLRFPKLFAITAALFVIDLIFPDMVPFVDEILLGLISLLFASLRNKPKALRENNRTRNS